MQTPPRNEREATIAQLRERLRQIEQFRPTADCINALTETLRQWIMKLETRCDPAGDVERAVSAEDLCRQLEARILQLSQDNAAKPSFKNRELDENRPDIGWSDTVFHGRRMHRVPATP